MIPLVVRAEQFLLVQTEPLLMGDVCEGLGITRGMSTTLVKKLERHLGGRLLVVVRRTRRSDSGQHQQRYFSIEGATLAPKRKGLFVPRELYRGWRNPVTGITGARLGVDL